MNERPAMSRRPAALLAAVAVLGLALLSSGTSARACEGDKGETVAPKQKESGMSDGKGTGCEHKHDHAQGGAKGDNHHGHHGHHGHHTEKGEGHGHHGGGHKHHERSAAEWIAILDDPARLEWQKPDGIVEALALKGGELVVDVGAASGSFTTRLARAVPKGRVIATDIDPELITHLGALAKKEGLANVFPTLVGETESGVPKDTDLVFMANVLHHLPDPAKWLIDVVSTLRPGARVALVEFTKGDHPVGPPDSEKYSRDQLSGMFDGAGLRVVADHEGMLPYHHVIILAK
jgi:arsenite methyltransferase